MSSSVNSEASSTSTSTSRPRGFDATITLEQIRQKQDAFCLARDWEQYHTPRNLILAMMAEMGELCEIFQWRGEVKAGVPELTPAEHHHLGEELSDIALYLIRIADRCHVDLPKAIVAKMTKNALKYPIDRVKGRSDKYNEYKEWNEETNNSNNTNTMQSHQEEKENHLHNVTSPTSAHTTNTATPPNSHTKRKPATDTCDSDDEYSDLTSLLTAFQRTPHDQQLLSQLQSQLAKHAQHTSHIESHEIVKSPNKKQKMVT